MYHGTVSVPHNKLQTFLKTAEALKIKGIVDTGGMEGRQWAGQDQSSPAPPGPVSQVGELVTAGPPRFTWPATSPSSPPQQQRPPQPAPLQPRGSWPGGR